MKKLLFLLTFMLITGLANAQFRRPFAYGGLGYNPSKELSLSGEVGYWGIESATSFAVTYDAVFVTDSSSTTFHWLGFKPYYTVLDNKEISVMIYMAPKVNTNNPSNMLLEWGFNPLYKIHDDYLLSATLSNQTTRASQFSFSLSFGLVKLF